MTAHPHGWRRWVALSTPLGESYKILRIDGCRELTGYWFSPRETFGMQQKQSLIAAEQIGEGHRRRQRVNAKTSALSFNPSRSTPLSAQVETRARYTAKQAVSSRVNGS